MELSEREQRIQEICAEWRRLYYGDIEEMLSPADDDEATANEPWTTKGDRLLLELIDLDAFPTALDMVMKEGFVETDLYGFIQILAFTGKIGFARMAADRIPPTDIDTMVHARSCIALEGGYASDIAILRLLVQEDGEAQVVLVEGGVTLWRLTNDERDLQSARSYATRLPRDKNQRSLGFLKIAEATGVPGDFIKIAASLSPGVHSLGHTKENLAIICAYELSRRQDMRATVRSKIVAQLQAVDKEFGDAVFKQLREAHYI